MLAGEPAVECHTIGTLSESLRLALIRLPEVHFPQNETLRMYFGSIQPCFAVVATTWGLFRFPGPFQRTSRRFKNSIGYWFWQRCWNGEVSHVKYSC